MTRTAICTTLALMLTISLAAQDTRNASALLQAAQTKESIQNDLSGAILLYEQAVRAAGSDRALAPRTLLALARAYEKAGRDEARSTYERIVNEYNDSGAAATTARARLTALQQSAAGPFKERVLETDSANATVSWDGTLSAYVSYRTGHAAAPNKRTAGIYVRNLTNGRERLVAPPRGPDEAIPEPLAWSPDSQRISYQVLTGPRTREQRIVAVANGTVTVLPVPDSQVVFASSWSPDSQRLVIGSRSIGEFIFELQLIEVATGSSVAIGRSISDASGVRWSNDSSRFAYVPADKALVRVMSNSGQEVKVFQPPSPIPETRVTLLRWTPDDRLIYARSVAGGNDFYVVLASGGEAKKVCEGRGASNGDTCGPFSPDGKWVAIRKIASGGGRMAIRSTSDGSERFLTNEAVVEEAAGGFSPDSQFFAFRSNREGPWAVYVAPVSKLPAIRPVRIVQLESMETQLTASWTSRGGLILKMSNSQMDLYRVNVDGSGKPVGDPIRLTRDSLMNSNPLVSPDGKRVAYVSRLGGNGTVEVMDANGANRKTIRTAVTGEILGWKSPTTLVVATGTVIEPAPILVEWNLQLLDITSGQLSQAGPPLRGSGLQYAPGANEIVAWLPNGNDLQVRSLDGGISKIQKMSADFFDFTISRSGRWLSYSTADSGPDGKKQPAPGETRLMNLQTGDDRLLLKYADSRNGNHGTLEFSDDDRLLLYADPNGFINVLNIQTLDHWLVSKEQASLGGLFLSGIEPSWSPDGSFIVLGGHIMRESLRLFEGITASAVTRATR